MPGTAPAAPLTDRTVLEPTSESDEIDLIAQLDTARLTLPIAPDTNENPPPDRILQPPLSLAEAERRYAATGIWQLDPSPLSDPAGGDRLENLLFAAIDPSLQPQAPTALLDGSPDSRPGALAPPAPLGLTFDLDRRGLIRATPEGNVSPDGTLVFLGRPPVIPGIRPGTPLPDVGVALEPEVETPETPLVDPTPEVAAPTPELLTPETPETPLVPETTTTETAPEPELPELTPEQEILRQIRPPARPTELEETFEQAPDGEAFSNEELALIRPQPRPGSVQEEAEADEELAAEDDENAQTLEDEGTELAIATSALPSARPAKVERAAAEARENATDSPQEEEEADAEPEVAAAPPNIPTRASVARAATETNAINLSKVNLIGVYGSASERRALIRLKNGRYVKVEVGDRVDGGRVSAIGATELRYTKGGRNITLKLPKG